MTRLATGPAEKPSAKYEKANKLASALAPKVHYTVDEKQKSILITDDGYEAAEDVLQVCFSDCTVAQLLLHVMGGSCGCTSAWLLVTTWHH